MSIIVVGDEHWTTATYCIDECALIKGLRADTTYRFRISAINDFGQSPFSWASIEIRTKKKGTLLSMFVQSRHALFKHRPQKWRLYATVLSNYLSVRLSVTTAVERTRRQQSGRRVRGVATIKGITFPLRTSPSMKFMLVAGRTRGASLV